VPLDSIIVRGAREHNLKNVDIEIPRGKLVVITGVSGSGKSSLAFDTIYAEGQRRYVESLSAYARQFLGQMEKPEVDYIEGLSPAISIDQKGVSKNPRSTVGTVTEIYDYLRLLFARAGRPHCPKCGRPIDRQTVTQIVDAIREIPAGRRLMILAPVVRDRKGEHLQVLEDARRAGFVRARVDGDIRELDERITLNKNQRHTIEIVVDRLISGSDEGEGATARLADSVEQALKVGESMVLVSIEDPNAEAGGSRKKRSKPGAEDRLFSEHFACVDCGISLGEIAPRDFSFNSPHGACPACTGLGVKMELDPSLVIPNRDLSLAAGAVQPWSRTGVTSHWFGRLLEAVANAYGFSVNQPVRELTDEQMHVLLYGTDGRAIPVRYVSHRGHNRTYETAFEGVVRNLERRYQETDSEYVRTEIERYMTSIPCPVCEGKRLRPESLAFTVAGSNIYEVTKMNTAAGVAWLDALEASADAFTDRERMIADRILKEIRARLTFLVDVGLDYITLDRSAGSLSGGEAQRIRLATQIGSSLMGVLYVCDEPSIGLHPVDDERLIGTLRRLRDIGNTVLVVEHDESMMRSADWIIDMGPGAGEHGGHVVAEGPIEAIEASEASITGAYLSGRRTIPVPGSRREGNGLSIVVRGARENNLKNIDVEIPLGKFVCVTGVSGSGKSTLIEDILYRRVAQVLYGARARPGLSERIDGLEEIDKVVDIDQSPIGRTPRSNPATYTGTFTPIRELFASLPEAKARGYSAGRFSFNVKGGRCEACRGEGYTIIEMNFLPDVTVACEICKGSRYNREALEIRYKGKNIAEVLDMTVDEALEFFQAQPRLRLKLATLSAVGLGYIHLGQPATQLSGGEAQRIKLSTELSRRSTGRTLYILDEPTTGLSFEDTKHLLEVLQKLVDQGNTVVVIEHNLDVMKCADWIIDLGPNGGDRGGELLAEGTPEQVAEVPDSFTGAYLRRLLRPTLERGAEAVVASA
jgi:excinuclease ABC subunit A